MRGHRNIATSFDLQSVARDNKGAFDWMHRMGIHLAFHRAPGNILLHIIMPPFNALGVFLLLYPFALPGVSVAGEPVTLSLIVFVVSFVIMARVDLLSAILTAIPMALVYPVCGWFYSTLGESIGLMMSVGAGLFLLALWVQVAIGHGACEQGIGDEDENIAELLNTKNPVYFVLLPQYQFLELLFLMGYRKATAEYVFSIMEELRPQVEARKAALPSGKGI